MFKLFALFVFFLLSFLSSISADDVVPGSQYRTTDTVETLSGTTIDVGELVEALAVSNVADIVSPSGQLLTFKYQNRIFNADFDGFEQALSEYRVRYVNANQDVAGADVCFDVFHSDSRITLPPIGKDHILIRYVSVKDANGSPVPLTRVSTRPNEDGDHRLCLGGLTPSTDYQVTVNKGYPVRSCRARGAEICSDEKTEMDVTLRLTTAALTPSILVDNSKLILPLVKDAVIPVKVTNIGELSYQLFRIQDRQIANSGFLFGELSGWGINQFRENTELVAEGSLVPPDSKLAQAMFNIDVSAIHDDLTGGVYALVMDSPAV